MGNCKNILYYAISTDFLHLYIKIFLLFYSFSTRSHWFWLYDIVGFCLKLHSATILWCFCLVIYYSVDLNTSHASWLFFLFRFLCVPSFCCCCCCHSFVFLPPLIFNSLFIHSAIVVWHAYKKIFKFSGDISIHIHCTYKERYAIFF